MSANFLGLTNNFPPFTVSQGLGSPGQPAQPTTLAKLKANRFPTNVCAGYWGRDLRCRIGQDATQLKIRDLLATELLGTGLRVGLYLPVHEYSKATYPITGVGGDRATSGTLKCSCVKESGQNADRRCNSCYGTDFVPGYRKFGYQTLWIASISPGLVVNNVALNTVLKPYRWELLPNATTGSIETPDLPIAKTIVDGAWDFKNDWVSRDPNSSVTVYFSTNQGSSWYSIDSLPVINPLVGLVRFRIVISRPSTQTPSPMWEVFRARYPTIPVAGRLGPWILMLRNQVKRNEIEDMRGIVEDGSLNFWTMPLSMFDCNLAQQNTIDDPGDPESLMKEPCFIEFIDGFKQGERWSVTRVTYTDPLGFLIRQFFDARKQQQREFTSLVF